MLFWQLFDANFSLTSWSGSAEGSCVGPSEAHLRCVNATVNDTRLPLCADLELLQSKLLLLHLPPDSVLLLLQPTLLLAGGEEKEKGGKQETYLGCTFLILNFQTMLLQH